MKKLLLLTILSLLCAISCGGGSAGTGTVSLRGKLITPDNQPVAGAEIVIVETGESVVTSADGNFVIDTPTEREVQVEVRSEELTTTVALPPPVKEEARVGVELELDRENSRVEVREYEVAVSFTGECARYFNNTVGTLYQTRPLPDETVCRLQVRTSEGGAPLGGVLVQLQRRRCDADARWRNVTSARTDYVGEVGLTEIEFIFRTDEEHCRYRIAAPVRDSSRAPIYVEIVRQIEQP
jgi:hypothetical protein